MRILTVLRPADWVGLAIFIICYGGYPLVYSCVRRFGRHRLRCHVFNELRQAVAKDVVNEEGRRLLAASFQTYMRTLVFLGTVAFLALGGALGLFFNSDGMSQIGSFSLFADTPATPDGIRLRLLVFVLLAGFAFMQFVWGLKALYTLTLAQHTRDPKTILHYLDHLDLDFSRGIRTLYYLSVLFLWFIGSELFIAGSLILTLMIYRFDFMKSRS